MKEKKENTFYVDKIKELEFCDNKALVFSGNEFIIPYEVTQSKGEHSIENCEGQCKESQKVISKQIRGKFRKFPDCCDHHKKLKELKEFKKTDFKNIPNSIANKVMFTYSHILNNVDNENWDTDIQDYIHYVVNSFGSFPTGYGEPFYLSNYYTLLIERMENIKSAKSDTIDSNEIKKRANKILKSLKAVFKPHKEGQPNFEIILSVYNEWYKIFPFDISYFKHLKSHFKSTFPIHTGRTRYNQYSKETIKEIHTKESLSKILITITKDILQNINGATLYEKGLLTDVENKKLELLINQRKTNLKKFETKNISDVHKYRKALNFWFKGEKKFIKEITPILKISNSRETNQTRPNRSDIAYFCYYTSQTKSLKTNNPFPSDKAWNEVGELFSKNSKNIQKAYNTIVNNREERLKKTKVNNIHYVIENMLKEYPKALKLAKDELKLA